MQIQFNYFFAIFFCALFFFQKADAQYIDSLQENILIENVATNTDAEVKFDVEQTQLLFYKKHPLNLNTATEKDLQDLGLLTDLQIQNLIRYKKENGKLLSVYELQSLNTFDIETIRRIFPFVTVEGNLNDYHISVKELFSQGRFQFTHRINTTLETPIGYSVPDSVHLPSNKYYEGTKIRFYNRFLYSYGSKLSYGITTEKDAGEAFFKGTEKQGFDFYSVHFYLKTNLRIETIVLGDYEMRLGQGLAMYTGFGFTKTALVTAIKKEFPTLMPYRSTNEFNFLRGAAITYRISKNQRLTPFVSYRKLDGNLLQNDSTIQSDNGISTLQTSGYHRTLSEIQDKNTQSIFLTGAHYQFEKHNIKIGASGIHGEFGLPIQKLDKPYNLYDFTGKQWNVMSADYSFVFRNLNFFGEGAFNDLKKYATVHGLIASLNAKLDAVFLYRNYQPGYFSLYSLGFGENTAPANENGFYSGFIAHSFSKISISAYADYFQFPWLKFTTDAPSHGFDYLAQLTFQPDKNTSIYLRYQYKSKQTNESPVVDVLLPLWNENTQHIRFNAAYKATDAISLCNRLEWIQYQLGNNKVENGFLIFQDMVYNPSRKLYDIGFRLALFNTDSYNTRVYAIEHDVPGSFTVPALYGKGAHCYVMLRYKFFRKIDTWLRVGETVYPFQTNNGSGLDQINSNHKTDVRVQVRWEF